MPSEKEIEAAARKMVEITTIEDDLHSFRPTPISMEEYIDEEWQDWIDEAQQILTAAEKVRAEEAGDVWELAEHICRHVRNPDEAAALIRDFVAERAAIDKAGEK